MKKSTWVPPAAIVSGVLLLGVVAEVTRPKTAPQSALSSVASAPIAQLVTTGTGPVTVAMPAAQKAEAQAVAEPVDICPGNRRGPCYATPHTKLRCNDPEIAGWLASPMLWELWCMDGTTEKRLAGRWPKPEARPNPCDWRLDLGQWGCGPMASAKMEVQSDEATKNQPQGFAEVEAQRRGALLAGRAGEAALYRNDGADTTAQLPNAGAHGSDFDWVTAQDGDRYCPRVPKLGWCDEPKPAIPGETYLSYAGRLTHVTLLDCSDERVTAAIANKWVNVFCMRRGATFPLADGIVHFNPDAKTLTAMRVFSDHDRMIEGRSMEEYKWAAGSSK